MQVPIIPGMPSDEIWLKLSPTGSGSVNYRSEENIINDIPNAVDKICNTLKSKTYLQYAGNETCLIRIDIEAL